MLFIRQVWALICKNLLIVVGRHAFSTPLRCFLLPVVFTAFMAYTRNLFIPPAHYGIGKPAAVRSLSDALKDAGGGRDTVAFVNSGFTGGSIEKVIDQVANTVKAEGKLVDILQEPENLITACRSTLRGTTRCFGAAVFYASPDEGPGRMWNYSLRADGALGSRIDTQHHTNDVEIYPIPLQHEIDFAIASQNATVDQSAIPTSVNEYSFTSKTQQQRDDDIRTAFMSGVINILAVAFFIGSIGVVYQLVGFMASERELGMTQLIDASMPNKKRWEPQLARIIANHVAFDWTYLPGWIIDGLIFGFGVFSKTSIAIVLIFHILTGLALSSFSIFGAAFFHKAQLSGISTTIISLLLAVLAQVVVKANTGAIAILSLLFPPMNYVFFTVVMARWEHKNLATNLVKSAPDNPSTLPGIVHFIFFILQILIFPVLGALLEKYLYGTASKGRIPMNTDENTHSAVRLDGFTKSYKPSWWACNISTLFGKRKETVVAVDDLNLSVPSGQIMVLLGANGSGKSTTLEAIAGLRTVTSGSVAVDGFGGLGFCPQRNVMWAELTALEHIRIFNRLKSTGMWASAAENKELLASCDLDRKLKAQAHQLSGGQKRKLQLAMMLTGGSRVCCVDECSSGVDALARQKLWQILLAERGKRTIIFTTHFLDEADLLSDQIAILSKGSLKAQGSAVELKHRIGEGYRIHVLKTHGDGVNEPKLEGVARKELYDQTIYSAQNSAQVAELVKDLEAKGIQNYEITSPTIEDVFFKVAEDAEALQLRVQTPQAPPNRSIYPRKSDAEVVVSEEKNLDPAASDEGLKLQAGRSIGAMRQAWTLFRKRWTVFQRNYLPYVAAFLIPVIAAGLVTLFLKGYNAAGCSAPQNSVYSSDIQSLLTTVNYSLVVGPSSRITPEDLTLLESSLPSGDAGGGNLSALQSAVHLVDNFAAFNDYIHQNFANITPGGFYLGNDDAPPTFAFKINGDISLATITQNALNTLLTNVSISSQYQSFDVPWAPGTGKSLQLITYFGLAMAAFPAFFGLYPTLERLRSVRQLHYSNGVRSVSLWSAYIFFDFIIVTMSSIIAIIIFRGVSDAWYHPEYLFVVFLCYGLASTLMAYVISLFARSQLAAFAWTAGYQAVMFLLSFIAYLSVLTYAPPNKIDSLVNVCHFTISLITPVGSLLRSMFVALNTFSLDCRDRSIASYPGEITLYGGPILYLLVQSALLFGILLWNDSGSAWSWIFRLRRHIKSTDTEDVDTLEDEIATEVRRVQSSSNDDGLRVVHATKAFGKNIAVKDVTFGVQRGEVFALLGPNGAGKSTTISLIRGDIRPTHSKGEVFVENIPISKQRASARTHLGVCPQVDAMDTMTVIEHLRFYASVRGVAEVENNVSAGMKAVGLESYANQMAAKLSGGNKRKLSLAIALMGNPSVLLLDEPSSGMDVCAKRIMWRTLASVVPGRSLVLTTHSMEEADALADRAGIMGGRMLALGTSDYLRKKYGDRHHVHLITTTAPHTSTEEMDRIKSWIVENFEGAEVEQNTFHGQLRFSVPASHHLEPSQKERMDSGDAASSTNVNSKRPENGDLRSGLGVLFTALEAQKQNLGFEYFSVSQTTLDQVFLSIVGKHKIEEENYAAEKEPWWKKRWWRLRAE